jgi:hypothetical protein
MKCTIKLQKPKHVKCMIGGQRYSIRQNGKKSIYRFSVKCCLKYFAFLCKGQVTSVKASTAINPAQDTASTYFMYNMNAYCKGEITSVKYSKYRSRIHEQTISFRFLGILLRFFPLSEKAMKKTEWQLWHTFSHDGKISAGLWGGGGGACPIFSLPIPFH